MLQALRRFTSGLLRTRRERGAYRAWMRAHEGGAPPPERGPLISVLLAASNAADARRSISSLDAQTYCDWEAVVAPFPGVDLGVAHNARVRVLPHVPPSNALEACLNAACGIYAGAIACGDTLAPDALAQCAARFAETQAAVVFTDRDSVDRRGIRYAPFFKPGWAPESFLARDYLSGLALFSIKDARARGGFRSDFSTAQEYDLLLRLTDHGELVSRVPLVLYHHHQNPPDARDRGDMKRAIEAAVSRRGETANVSEVDAVPFAFTVRYALRKPGKVSIVIPSRDRADLLEVCLDSLFTKSTYADFEVILVDNGSTEDSALALLDEWRTREPEQFRVIADPRPFNYAALNNAAAASAAGEYLVFLNNDTAIVTPDWLEAMMEQAQRPQIGAVGAMLLYADGTLQHAGVILGVSNGVATHGHYGLPSDDPGYFGQAQTINNYAAVTGACMMMRREVFDKAGGFDEALAVSWNDVDLCLRVRALGYRNVYLPHVRLYHYESKTRSGNAAPETVQLEERERAIFKSRWAALIEDDPYYSPNLSREERDYRIR